MAFVFKKARCLLLVLMCNVAWGQNTGIIDSLNNLLRNARHDTSRVHIYNLLGYEYRNSDASRTDSFADLAIHLALNGSDFIGLGNAYVNKGAVRKLGGDYAGALQAYQTALLNFVKVGYTPGYSTVYNNIAGVHYLQSNYLKAQYYFFQALNMSARLKDEAGMAKMFNNIGAVYMEQSQFDKALMYFTKAYEILKKKDPNQAADCLNNIGTVYQYKGDTINALINYQKCMQINKQIGDRKDVSVVLNNIGYMYFEGGNYKLALDHFYQSLQIDGELGDVRALSTSYGVIASCYHRLKMLHAANRYALLMLDLAKKHNIRTDIVDAYRHLDSIEEAKGNYKQALEYTRLSRLYNDSINNEKSSEAQSQLEMLYQKERAEKERIISGKEDEMKSFRAREKEKEISHYILLIGLILLLFILLIYVFFFILRRNKTS